jgi:heptosyltransferase III
VSTSGKILVIRGGAIGDFILTLPAIAALRQQFPQAHLEVLGYSHIAQLAKVGGLVDRVASIEAGALAGFFTRNGTLNPDLADYFSEFDIIISYLYDPDSIFQTNVNLCSPAQFILGPHRADDRAKIPASKVYLKPLERLAIFDPDPVPRLTIPPAEQAARASLADAINHAPRVALHPGSGSERKNWPEQHWAELIQTFLNETSQNLLLIGGEAECERVQRLAAALPPARVMVIQSRTLPEVAAAVQHCTTFIGHDSGISHLAAALGLEGIVLWAETVAEVWRPPSEKVRLLRHATGLNALTPREVFAYWRKLES